MAVCRTKSCIVLGGEPRADNPLAYFPTMNTACHFAPLLNCHLLRASVHRTLQSLPPASDWQSVYKLTDIPKEQNQALAKYATSY